MPRESAITTQIMDWLTANPNIQARKLRGSPFAVRGDPDIFGCIHGRMFLIEVKQPGEKTSPIQNLRLEQWKAAGAITTRAYSIGEVRMALKPYMSGKEA